MKPNTNQAEPAELPDDVDISGGANYELDDPCRPINPQPGFRYFAAANDGDNSRPDGVARIKQQGYEVCAEERCNSTDCTLMRIPQAKWDAMDRRRKAAANKAAVTEGGGIQGVPEEATFRSPGHGQIKRTK